MVKAHTSRRLSPATSTKRAPFNPLIRHTTNKFNILIAIGGMNSPAFPILSGSAIFGTPLRPLGGVWKDMHKPIKYIEKAATYAAGAAWAVFDKLNQIGQ